MANTPTTSTTTTTSSTVATVTSTGNSTAKKPFRLQARNVLLTFPQTSCSKEDALQRLLRSTLQLKGVLIAQEKHADGSPHLHIAIFLKEKLTTRDPNFFDFICESHGNYQPVKNIPGTISYLKKEDPEPLAHGDIPLSTKGSSVPKSLECAQMVMRGCTTLDVNTWDAGYFLLNKRKVEEYESWYSVKKANTALKSLQLPIQYTGQDLDTVNIVAWLNSNLCTTRPFKSRQLYLSGPPNCLKTSLVLSLGKYLRIYHMPLLEAFFDYYYDDSYDLVFLDEFHGHHTISFLNLWAQGAEMTIRKKGSQVLKKTNLPMIVCSNFRLDECYKDPAKINAVLALKERFLEIQLHAPIDLDKIVFPEKQ